ncbi:MAG: glycoside hydrolase family 2 [Armatimonadetes bacterium]|jgi:beta-mannosidase|nr:glycoside hydrolase family 2 [Armatimonadota bacterium]
MTRLLLDGNWTLTHFREGSAAVAHPDELDRVGAETLAAQVPGNVELDLVRAGVLPDPFYGDNVHQLRPLEFHEWWYRRSFQAPELAPGQRAELVFEGLDCLATIWLNGVEVGRADNMLVAHRFDVTAALKPGAENALAVRLASTVNAARAYEPDPCEGHLTTNWELLSIRKAAHMGGWDIAPRVISAGIWRSVALEIHEPTEIVDLYYYTPAASDAAATLGVHFHFRTDAPELDGFALRFTGVCGESRFSQECPVYFVSGQCSIPVERPKLWWPKGYGDPHLYQVTCELLHHGQVVDQRQDQVGIRTLKLHRTEITGQDGGEFRFEVNGTPILVKGANWVPADAFHSRDAERYEPCLALFDDLGCNMIRSWGGGVYEDHAFFDYCDAHGMLVWQDFAFACARYPQNPEFLEAVRREAEQVVRKLRNHPSLAVWCGDNECDEAWLWGGFDPGNNRLTREVLPQVVSRCDPWRSFLPSSPYHAPETVRRGNDRRLLPEEHLWGPRDYFKSRCYTENRAHFIGEIGYHGCPNVSSLRRFLDEKHLWPYQGNSQWITHCTDSVPGGGPYQYRVQLMADQIQELFGVAPDNLEEFALASQISQAEAKKFFVEMTRLKKWQRTGVLWWNVIDCWPQFSDAIVDYYYGKKLAYHYLRRVQAPVCLMVDEPESWHVRVVAGNDSRQPASGPYRIWDADTGETLMQGEFHTEANANQELGRLRISHGHQRLFLIQWELAGKTYGNHYLLGKPPISFEQYRRWLKAIAALPEGFDAEAVAR